MNRTTPFALIVAALFIADFALAAEAPTPETRAVWLATAEQRRKEGKPALALTVVQKVVALDRAEEARAEKVGDLKALQKARALLAESQELLAAIQEAANPTDALPAIADLALTQERLGLRDKAEATLARHLRICQKHYAADHAEVTKSMNLSAHILFRQGRTAESLKILLKAAKLVEARNEDAAALGQLLANVGVVYKGLNKYAEAETYLLRGLKIQDAKVGAEHLDTAHTLQELGILYRSMGQSARAIPSFQRAVRIREAKLGEDHVQVAEVLNFLALARMEAGQHRDVLPLLERCLKIREAKLPANDPLIASSLNNLAVAHMSSGVNDRHEKAFDLLQRGLKILEAVHGKSHADIGIQLVNMAAVCQGIESKRGEAEGLYLRALEVMEASQGPNHSDVAECLERLADLSMDKDKPAAAEKMYRRCLKIREVVLVPTHPDLIRSVENLMAAQARQERWKEVADQFDRVNRLMRMHVRYNLPALSPPQQMAYLQRTHEAAFHRCLTLPFLQQGDAALVARSAEWVLNGKAVGHQAKAEQTRLLRESNDPEARDAIRQLLALRGEAATLALQGAADDATKRRIEQLEQEQSDLASRLQLGKLALDSGDAWVTLEQIRKRIPADAVLVEIVDFDLWDFKTNQWKTLTRDEDKLKKMTEMERAQSRYIAWIIPPAGKGQVRYVDLGNSWEIRGAVDDYQKAMKAALRNIQVDEGDAEAELRKHTAEIAKRCLAPLEPHLTGSPRWLLSLDNHLWLVPWAALPLKDGSYAVEKHTISYLVSGRDLLPTAAGPIPGPALVLGDPNFDLSADGTQRQVKQLVPKDRFTLRGPGPDVTERVSRDWQRLFGTADEIKAITPKLAAYTKGKVQVHTGDQAVQSVVKAVRSPRILVLSTHGFVVPPPPTPLPMARHEESLPGRKIAMRIDGLTPVEAIGDPLLRCGLIFAGANQRAKDGSGADNGVLTGVEVLGIDLRGTELVVLSACETGLGDVNLGEGVAGLRQAFQLAGAQGVVASLWKVSDQESAKLMTLFWENLAAGKGKAEALRSAQLTMVKDRRKKEKAAHPFFWAAFTFTGAER
ncbi:MAG: CHAT domain-containing protein [Gemmataceae bacterium]|nr:CHAT domain-containing protein [Gemmataceae bacterium]